MPIKIPLKIIYLFLKPILYLQTQNLFFIEVKIILSRSFLKNYFILFFYYINILSNQKIYIFLLKL